MVTAEARPRVRRVDVLVAAADAVAAIALLLGAPAMAAGDPDSAQIQFASPADPSWWVVAAVLTAQACVLLWARNRPRTTLVAVAVLAAVLVLVAPSVLHGLSTLAVMVAVVLAVLRQPLAWLWPALVTAAVGVGIEEAVWQLTGYGATPVQAITQGLGQAGAVIGLPLLVTLVVRSRLDVRAARARERDAVVRERDAVVREQDAVLRERDAVVREQDARVEAAVSRERAAMARELHDIAAHHLSGIALMAAVIDRQIDSDPERAHAAVRQVREQSTAVLDDLRRLVGLLRDDTLAERSVETLAAVPDLVARAQRHGRVTLRVLRGEPEASPSVGSDVGPLAQLAAYRTVQEALANAALHAPGAATTVELDDREHTHVTVVVRNGPAREAAPRSSSGGHGLVGMRERADLVGADLRYGPTEDGGWEVRLVVPRAASGPDAPAVGAEVPS
ncbi:histidine kinase [Curtobacterium sp. MCBD17_003]|uniref:sensor histidine kinase n=1 Tax=Curtobacterium sp. MCBD17_003 TaxID=2175667 RepID=UPI000DA81008|nr:histidine kinase [Curtobacterium sp. MCBD17_003]WIE54573.1 histidine kinase [Curtobacterium sp. MCBD17_003]